MSKKSQDVVIEAFTDLADNYASTIESELRRFWGISYEDFVTAIVHRTVISPGEVILDIATGMAVIPLSIADQVGQIGNIIGLDITYAMLNYAANGLKNSPHAERIKLICGSGMMLPFTENHFDMVICGLGMHHMDVSEALIEIMRALKPGGRLVVADVGASQFWRSWVGILLLKVLMYSYGISRGSARAKAEIDAFPNVKTKDEWLSLLANVGFVEIGVDEIRALRPWFPSGFIFSAIADK